MDPLTVLRPGEQGTPSKKRVPWLSFLFRSQIFGSLQFRDFRWIWIGTLTSAMAFNMQMIARAWLVLRLQNDSPFSLSLVMMSFALPMTFVSPISGALADRIPRKRIIILSQGGNAVMTLLLATLDMSGLINFWQLLVFGFVNGSMIAFNMPSRQALISEIVGEKDLMNAISLNSSAMNLTRVIGPAAAGVLIIYLGTAGVFYLIAGCYVIAMVAATMVRAGKRPANRSGKSVTRDMGEGFSYALGNPILLGLVIMAFIPTLFGFSYYALLPAWAREALDVQSDGLGMLMMMMGVGALIGTLALASMRNLPRRGAFLLANSIVWGIALAVFSQSTSYSVALPLLLLLGLLSSVFMSLNMTLIQIYSSHEMRGRMMSIAIMTFGVMPLSSVPFGAIAESMGTSNALGLSGVLLALVSGVFALVYPEFRKIA